MKCYNATVGPKARELSTSGCVYENVRSLQSEQGEEARDADEAREAGTHPPPATGQKGGGHTRENESMLGV
jgi:hypothetical protein